jgi:hypothetical protein
MPVSRSIVGVRANPPAVTRAPVATARCNNDAAVAETAAITSAIASAAADDHAAATTKASATATAETSATTEAAAATATTAAATTTATATAAGISRGARCGQQQRRSADDAEAVNANQGKRCQPACEKGARRILSHLDLPGSVKQIDVLNSSIVELAVRLSDACENQIVS